MGGLTLNGIDWVPLANPICSAGADSTCVMGCTDELRRIARAGTCTKSQPQVRT